MLDPLLELPAIGVRLARLDLRQLGLRCLELRLRPGRVDLVQVDRIVDKHFDLHVVVDNYGTHKTAAVKAWIAKTDSRTSHK